MNLIVQHNAADFFTSWATVSCLRNIFVHKVGKLRLFPVIGFTAVGVEFYNYFASDLVLLMALRRLHLAKVYYIPLVLRSVFERFLGDFT
jgi:hypothetical protein